MAVLGATINTDTELSQLVAKEGCIMKQVTLKVGAGALARGTVLEMVSTSGTTWQQLTAAAGTNARAILAQTVANNASATTKAWAYFVGLYRENDMVWPTGITSTQKRAAILGLADRGIIIDETIEEAAPTTTTTTTTTSTTTTTTTAA